MKREGRKEDLRISHKMKIISEKSTLTTICANPNIQIALESRKDLHPIAHAQKVTQAVGTSSSLQTISP